MWSESYNNPHEGSEHPEGELAAFALNALDDAEFQAVFHHVIQCLHCQEVLLGFQETSARLTGAAPEAPLPSGLRDRVLNSVTGREEPAPASPPVADARWSMRRLRRWLAPTAIGALSVLLVLSVGVIILQGEEINELTAAVEAERQMAANMSAALAEQRIQKELDAGAAQNSLADTSAADAGDATGEGVALAAAPSASARMIFGANGSVQAASRNAAAAADADDIVIKNAEKVDQMKEDMADVVEATVLSAQPETEKVPMKSPMGTEPEAKGVLMVEPNGKRGVLMVSGMPADTYQIWLMRGDHQVLVDRVVVNEDDGTGVQPIEVDESIFQYQQVALMPDERHGPTSQAGERLLTALIMPGPPVPPR